MASVSLAGVSKVFPGDVTAVSNFNLEIRDCEFVVLLGPSGCGKSTTLRLIAGLEDATAGEIQIGDHVVNDVAPKDRDIAMVFQNYALYPHLSVYKNISFGLELRYGGNWFHRTWKRLTSPVEFAKMATKRRGIRDEVRQTASALGIEHLLDRMPRQLSGGERQRVALGRAIVRHPAVFLFDEPLSNLDAKLRLDMRRELSELHERLATTMVYVTHDQTEAMTLGERIVVMDGGEIQQIGTPMEIYDQPNNRFVAEFIGSPAMNLIQCELRQTGDRLDAVTDGLQVSVTKEQESLLGIHGTAMPHVVLGIRPEDIAATQGSTDQSAASGQVVAVEPLGDCTLMHVAINGLQAPPHGSANVVVCKVEPRMKIKAGEQVRLAFSAERLHFFDAQTGSNLTWGRGSAAIAHE